MNGSLLFEGGASQGHLGHFDLISVYIHIDWTGRPLDKRDISAGQKEHVHGMVAIQKWRCPGK